MTVLIDKEENMKTRIIFVCSLCFGQFDSKNQLRQHMINIHKCVSIEPDSTTNDETEQNEAPTLRPMPFKNFRLILRAKMIERCIVTYACTYKFENFEKMTMHANCHKNPTAQQFKCTECNAEFENWRRCSSHLWKEHQIDVDLLHCPLCPFKASVSVLVWRHMRVHRRWRPRVIRSMKAVQQRRLQNAQNKVNSVNKSETKTNKYYAEKTCDLCSRKFVNSKTLSKHVKTVHNKIKPFICNVCGMKTARKSSLIIHMRQHTGEKPLQCKTCKFSTRDPSVLYKHQRRHERTGQFECSLCNYSCIQTAALKSHIRLKHPEHYKTISCDLCNYVTINKEKLTQHKLDHERGLISQKEEITQDDGNARTQDACDKNNESSTDFFQPLESVDSLPHEPPLDTGGVTIPANSEDTQFPTYLNN